MSIFLKAVLFLVISLNSYVLTLKKEWIVNGEYVEKNQGLAKFDVNGNFYTAKYSDKFLRKYSKNGNLIWKSAIDENIGVAEIVIDSNGTVYVGSEHNNARLGKYSSDGIHQWTNSYGDEYIESLNIALDNLGNIYISNDFRPNYDGGSFVEYHDLSIMKIAPDGAKKWQQTFASRRGETTNIVDYPISIKTDDKNNVYVLALSHGNYDGEIYADSDLADVIENRLALFKLSSNGTLAWILRSKRLAYELFTDNNNSIYSVYDSNKFTKINSDGSIDEKNSLDEITSISNIVDFKFDNEGNKYFLGSSYLQKVSPDKKLVWTHQVEGIGTAKKFRIDENGSFYIIGTSAYAKFTLTDDEIAEDNSSKEVSTLKYIANANGEPTWQLISAPIATNINVSELDAKKVYGFTQGKQNNYFYQPLQLEIANGYWLLPNKNQTITFNKSIEYTKEEMLNTITTRIDKVLYYNWQLFGVAYDTSVEELSKNLQNNNIVRIFQYNPKNNEYYTHTIIKAGSGFWIKLTQIEKYYEGSASIH